MLTLTRKVPKKSQSYSHYGDRNAIVITMEDGVTIEIVLHSRDQGDLRIRIDGPRSMNVLRKEILTGNKGIEYNKRKKADEERGINGNH